jgi:hypothetical protein
MSIRKYRKWAPSLHATGKWRVTVRAKLSETGKRRDEYFDTKKDAEKFIADTLEEREEHGKQSLSSGDLIGFNGSRPQIEGFTNRFTIGWSRKSFENDSVHSFLRLPPTLATGTSNGRIGLTLRRLVHPERSTHRKTCDQCFRHLSLPTAIFSASSPCLALPSFELASWFVSMTRMWGDVLWDMKEVHVRETVGKHT